MKNISTKKQSFINIRKVCKLSGCSQYAEHKNLPTFNPKCILDSNIQYIKSYIKISENMLNLGCFFYHVVNIRAYL
jgi:hypothetical protein